MNVFDRETSMDGIWCFINKNIVLHTEAARQILYYPQRYKLPELEIAAVSAVKKKRQ